MATVLSFKKNQKLQNPLLDEFFLESKIIDIIALNYDAHGTALCRCDGQIVSLDAKRIEKIILGAPLGDLTHFLQSIFDEDVQSEELQRIGDHIEFRLQELNEMKKYDLMNLAKATLKDFQGVDGKTVSYFIEQRDIACKNSGPPKKEEKAALYGNPNSHILHKTSCNSFNEKTCTEAFKTKKAAEKAGYKPCGLCKP